MDVLLYHSLEPGGSDIWPVIDPEVFYEHLDYLLAHGWNPLSLKEFIDWQKGLNTLEHNSFLLTFDDGAESIYNHAFPYLLKNDVPAVCFLIGKHYDPDYEHSEIIWVPKLTEEQIRKMHNSGLVSFHSHSFDLHSEIDSRPKALTATFSYILEDFLKSKEVISSITGEKVVSIAYPYGAVNAQVLEAAEKAGFTIGFTLDEQIGLYNESLQIRRISLDNHSIAEFKNYYSTMNE